MQARRSVLVADSAERMFDLIEAAEHYPAFLPWCASSSVLQRDDEVVVARLQVAYMGARFEFITRNPKRRPEFMAIGLEQGPFQRFEGSWNLKALTSWGCRIDFTLSYDFANSGYRIFRTAFLRPRWKGHARSGVVHWDISAWPSAC